MDLKFILKILGFLLLSFIGSYIIYYFHVSLDNQIDNINLNKYKKIMIVVYPDKENGIRSEWDMCYNNVCSDVEKI